MFRLVSPSKLKLEEKDLEDSQITSNSYDSLNSQNFSTFAIPKILINSLRVPNYSKSIHCKAPKTLIKDRSLWQSIKIKLKTYFEVDKIFK